jgi:hypothetical protein
MSTMPYLSPFVPCTLPTAPVSRSFGLRSSYEIDILDTDQRPRNKSLRCWLAELRKIHTGPRSNCLRTANRPRPKTKLTADL